MKKLFAALLVIATMFGAPALANARTVLASGTATEHQTVGEIFYTPNYGSWEVSFEADGPFSDILVSAWANLHVHADYDAAPEFSYGYRSAIGLQQSLTNTPSGFKLRYYVPPGEVLYYNGWVEQRWIEETFVAAMADVHPTDKPVAWAFYLSAAPEPATWAMMIIGFGVAGMSLRRRFGTTPLTA